MSKSINQLLQEIEAKKKAQREELKKLRKEAANAKRAARQKVAAERRAARKAEREELKKSRKALSTLIRDFVRKPTDKNHKDVQFAMKEWKKLRGE